jgi:hypothetical protein
VFLSAICLLTIYLLAIYFDICSRICWRRVIGSRLILFEELGVSCNLRLRILLTYYFGSKLKDLLLSIWLV